MGRLEALTVEGRCKTRPRQPKINDPSVAEVTLLGLLVARTGFVASQAGLGIGKAHTRQALLASRKVAGTAAEGVGRMGEPQA